jgi:hypothetical protein
MKKGWKKYVGMSIVVLVVLFLVNKIAPVKAIVNP